MKKNLAFLVVLALSTVSLLAKPFLTITDGNLDSVDIFNEQGVKVDNLSSLDKEGYMLHTKNEEIEATSDLGRIYLAPHSFIALTDTSEKPSLYLVFGKANLILDENLSYPLSIYTPTTVTEIHAKGESVFISTDEEERFYNFTDSNASSYNSINGKSYDIESLEFVDFMTNDENPSTVEKDDYKTLTKLNKLFSTPDAPQLEMTSRTLIPNIPAIPTIDITRALIPEKVELETDEHLVDESVERTIETKDGEIKITAGDGNATLSYPTNIQDKDIMNWLLSLSDKNTNIYSNISFSVVEPGLIEAKYPQEKNIKELEDTLDLIEKDILDYFNKDALNDSYEQTSKITPETRIVATEFGEIKIISTKTLTTILFPTTINDEDINNILSNLKLIDASSDFYKKESGEITAVPREDTDTYAYANLLAQEISRYFNSTKGDELEIIDDSTEQQNRDQIPEENIQRVKSSIVSSNKNRSFSFDLRLSTRAYTSSNHNQSLTTSIIPSFTYGSLNLALNIDPIAMLGYSKNENWLDWLGYSINFLETLQYRSLDEVFKITIDKDTNLNGDMIGLFDGVDHIWDKEYQPLTFNMAINSKHIEMNAFFNDLTFGRLSNSNDKKGIAGLDFGYVVSDDIPVKFALALMTTMDYQQMGKANIYPELLLYIPLHSKGYNKAGFQVGFANMIGIGNKNGKTANGGFMISGELPIEFYNFKSNIGIYYTNFGKNVGKSSTLLHYKAIENPRFVPAYQDDNLITLAGKIGYESKLFGLEIAMLGDITTTDMEFAPENSLLEASTYLSFSNVTLRAGLSMQNFTKAEEYEENAKLYSQLDLNIGGVSTSIKVGIDSIAKKQFFLSYGATASFIGKSKDSADNPIKIPFSFEISTGYEYRFDDGVSRYLIKPAMTFGNNDYALSLRAPLLLTFDDAGTFKLASPSNNGRKWWNFGSSETGAKKIFYAITDSLQLVNFIKLGNPESSVAYLDANRDFLMNDTLFTAFGSHDSLSIRAGFNFYNLSIGVYGGNIESPHIAELKIGIYPINPDSLSIGFSIPAEFYIKDFNNFELYFYPEVKLDIPLFWNHFNIALYAVGSVSANYEDGSPTTTNVFYDFKEKKLFAALLGGEMGFKWANFSLSLQGGWRTGPLTPDMYNIFTSTYNLLPSKDGAYDNSSFFAKTVANFDFKPFELELAYSLRDVQQLITNYKSIDNDIFSAKMKVNFNDKISLYSSFHRKGFVSLFKRGTDIKNDIFTSPNSIYSIGMDFNYGIVSVNAEFSSVLKTSEFASSTEYINTNARYNATKDISSAFSVTTRIKF